YALVFAARTARQPDHALAAVHDVPHQLPVLHLRPGIEKVGGRGAAALGRLTPNATCATLTIAALDRYRAVRDAPQAGPLVPVVGPATIADQATAGIVAQTSPSEGVGSMGQAAVVDVRVMQGFVAAPPGEHVARRRVVPLCLAPTTLRLSQALEIVV